MLTVGLLLLLEGALLGLRALGHLRAQAAAFLVLFAIAFLSFFVLAQRVLARRHETTAPALPAWMILLIGLIFRCTLLPLAPTLSDDIYRYLWDGRVQLAHINPYAYTPEAPELSHLRTEDFAHLNHTDIPTIYPPLTQLMFRLAAAIRPTITAEKFLFLAWDVLLMLLLLVALPRFGVPRAFSILYCWNPLVIIEVAEGGHNDTLGLFWLVLGCWLWTFQRPTAKRGAAIAWGLAFLSKFVSALLVPWLLLRRDARRYLGWFALTAIIGYLPFITGATQLFGGLQRFSAQWEFNSFGYALLHGVCARPAAVRMALLAALLAWSCWMAAHLDDVPSYLLATLGAAVLLAPVVEPWYLLWLVPFLCLRPRWSWLVFTGLVTLSYTVLVNYVQRGVWQIPLWVKWVEYGGLLILLIYERAAAARGGPKQSVSEAERARCPARRVLPRVTPASVLGPDDYRIRSLRADAGGPRPASPVGRGERGRDPSGVPLAGRDDRVFATAHPERPRHVSVIIPALNEEEGLRAVLREIPREAVEEIIVVDNGSTDLTAEVARAGGARVVCEPCRGYGQACLAGITALAPDTNIVIFLDADHSDYPEEIPQLIAPIQRGEADLVIGSRVLGSALPKGLIPPPASGLAKRARHKLATLMAGLAGGGITPQQRVGNWLACRLIAWRWGFRYTDLGPFRAVRRDVLEALRMQDTAFGWTVEMQLKALQRGARVTEVSVRYRPRIGRSKISGTFLGSVRAGVTILSAIARYAPEKNHRAFPRARKNMVSLTATQIREEARQG